MLITHGGGWSGGDKGAAREQNIGTTLAKSGYVGASVNYLLAKKQESFAKTLAEAVKDEGPPIGPSLGFSGAAIGPSQANPMRGNGGGGMGVPS